MHHVVAAFRKHASQGQARSRISSTGPFLIGDGLKARTFTVMPDSTGWDCRVRTLRGYLRPKGR